MFTNIEEVPAISTPTTILQNGQAFTKIAPNELPLWPDGELKLFIEKESSVSPYDINWAMRRVTSKNTKNHFYLRKKCLGVFICSLCKVPTRPCVAKKTLEKQKKTKCSNNNCDGFLTYFECLAAINYTENTKNIFIEHFGKHNHLKPPATGHLPFEIEKNLFEKIILAPKTTPKELIVTKNNSVRDLHPSLSNLDSLGYRRRKYLRMAGVSTCKNEENYLTVLKEIQEKNTDFIAEINLTIGREVFIIVPQYFDQLLLEINQNNFPIFSDATFDVLANFYVFTSSVFCNIINRHVPILISIIPGLSTSHFETHFNFLLQKNNFQPLFFVMDFSNAQKLALLNVFKKCTFPENSIAEDFIQGCFFHFKQSVQKLKKK